MHLTIIRPADITLSVINSISVSLNFKSILFICWQSFLHFCAELNNITFVIDSGKGEETETEPPTQPHVSVLIEFPTVIKRVNIYRKQNSPDVSDERMVPGDAFTAGRNTAAFECVRTIVKLQV